MAGSRRLNRSGHRPTVAQAKAALRDAAARRSAPTPGMATCAALCNLPSRCNPWVLVGSAAVAGVVIGLAPGALPAVLRVAAGAGLTLLGGPSRR